MQLRAKGRKLTSIFYSGCNLQFLWILKHTELQNPLPACKLNKIVCISPFPYYFFYEAWSAAPKVTKSFHLCSANKVAVLLWLSSWDMRVQPHTLLTQPLVSADRAQGFPTNWSSPQRETHLCRVSHHIQTHHMFTAPSSAAVHSCWSMYTVVTSPLLRSLGKVSYRQGTSELQVTQLTGITAKPLTLSQPSAYNPHHDRNVLLVDTFFVQ